MTKEVLISIRGLQIGEEAENEEEFEQIETICTGEYYYRNGSHFVLFDELMEGFEEPCRNMLKFHEKEFSQTRKGPVNVQMIFEESKKTMTSYMTPFGNIVMSFDTDVIEIEETEEQIKVHISYVLEANYQFVANCNIYVEIKAKENTETI